MRNTEEYRLELVFRRNEVTLRKITSKNTSIERIPLATVVQAEGPGLDVFVAGLPGYKGRYAIVDRWSGHDRSRVKTITLSVLKRSIENTSLGRRGIYEILIQPEDDSFRIKEKVLAEPPHYPVRVEYTREGKTFPASEVLSLASRPWCPKSDKFPFSARSPKRMSLPWNRARTDLVRVPEDVFHSGYLKTTAAGAEPPTMLESDPHELPELDVAKSC